MRTTIAHFVGGPLDGTTRQLEGPTPFYLVAQPAKPLHQRLEEPSTAMTFNELRYNRERSPLAVANGVAHYAYQLETPPEPAQQA